MSTLATQPQKSQRPTREEGLAIASQRKAARRRRTGRLRKAVAVSAVCAFIGPFGIIYMQMTAGKDPALAATQAVATKASGSVSQGTASATASAKRDAAVGSSSSVSTSGGSTSGGSTSGGSTSGGSTSGGSSSSGSAASASPAAVTTQQS